MHALTITLAMTLTGCLANPATGIQDTGDPLRVRHSSGTGTYTENEVVATDVYRDSDGNEVGTKETYKPVQHEFRWHDTQYFQGRDELDEQDFYRIAGDQPSTDEIARIRASAARKMKIGAPLLVGGYAAALVLSMIGGATNSSTLTTIGYAGGSTVGTVGGLVWYWGRNTMKKRNHLPPSRAERNADLVELCEEGRCRTLRGGRHTRR